MTAKLRELSAKSVPGLDPEKVSVMLVPVRDYSVVPDASGPSKSRGFWPHIAAALTAAAIIAALALRRRASKKKLGAPKESRPPGA